MFTGPVGPVEVFFYWPKAVLGNFYWPNLKAYTTVLVWLPWYVPALSEIFLPAAG